MKKTILISMLSLSLFLMACGKQEVAESQDKSQAPISIQNEPNQENGNVSKDECMRGCEMMWKNNEGNKSRTQEDMNNDCDNLCYSQQGIQNNDEDSCEKSEGILRAGCYSKIAETKKDVTICEKITEKVLLNQCYTAVAEATKDITICEKITDSIFKTVCEEGAKK